MNFALVDANGNFKKSYRDPYDAFFKDIANDKVLCIVNENYRQNYYDI